MFSLSSVGFADYLSPVKDWKISRKTKKPSPIFRILGLGDGFPFFTLMRYFPRVRELTVW